LLFTIFLGGCRAHTRTHDSDQPDTHRKDAEAREKDVETDQYRDFSLSGSLSDRIVYVWTDMYACSVCVNACVCYRGRARTYTLYRGELNISMT
jgi:hypothetical protein